MFFILGLLYNVYISIHPNTHCISYYCIWNINLWDKTFYNIPGRYFFCLENIDNIGWYYYVPYISVYLQKTRFVFIPSNKKQILKKYHVIYFTIDYWWKHFFRKIEIQYKIPEHLVNIKIKKNLHETKNDYIDRRQQNFCELWSIFCLCKIPSVFR